MSYVEELLKAPIRRNMRKDPPTVTTTTPVSDAIIIMSTENIGSVIVVDNKKPIGIITEKDLMEKVLKLGRVAELTQIGKVMSKPVITIDADKTIKEALDFMHTKKIRRLAITENGDLVGIITERRLLESALFSK